MPPKIFTQYEGYVLMKHLSVLAALLTPLPALADVDPSDWDAVIAAADGVEFAKAL